MASNPRSSFHVLMLPWLAHGHISPFLELAKQLSKKGFIVHFCSTPVNLSLIKKMICSGSEENEESLNNIHLLELHLPSLPELPPEYHTTKGLPPHLNITLRKAFVMSRPNFSAVLTSVKPDLFINDILQPWAFDEASSYNIPTISFIIFSAVSFSASYLFSYDRISEYPFSNIYLHEFEAEIYRAVIKTHEKAHIHEAIAKSSHLMLVNSSNKIEEKHIIYMSSLLNKKVFPIGPLTQDSESINSDDNLEVIEWLDKKHKHSTIFVSCGSEYYMSKEEMEEIGLGLELSDVNFIWVVRFPLGEKIEIEEALPKGFLERIDGKGIVVEGWAPQAKILAHESIGGFMSHCGWNSVVESFKFGVPIIAIPMHLEQPFNARLVVEIGVGLEVERDVNGRFQRKDVAKAVRKLVAGETSEDLKREAKCLSKIMKNKEENDHQLNEFIQEVFHQCNTTTV